MTDGVAAIQGFYGRWVRLYDRLATAPGVRSWRERAAASLALSPGDTVVEMGCGTGANFPHLRDRVGDAGRVVGLDLVPGMLRRARERIARAGWENVQVLRADAARPPVSEVDAVLSSFVVGMLSNPAEAVRTWCGRVRPGGRAVQLNAGQSDRPFALPLNFAFRLFVRLTTPSGRLRPTSPTDELETKLGDARDALFAATVDHTDERLALGFVRLAGGRIPDGGGN